MSVRDKGNIGKHPKIPRHGSWLVKFLWRIFAHSALTILVFAFLGGLFGYLAAFRDGEPASRLALVGLFFGGFLGIQLALSRVIVSKRKKTPIAGLAGAVAGIAIGTVLNRSPAELLLLSLCLAVAGAWGHSLLRHVNFP